MQYCIIKIKQYIIGKQSKQNQFSYWQKCRLLKGIAIMTDA